MEAKQKENLPQEGTSSASTGESLPEPSSGCPSYSGGGNVLRHMDLQKPTNKTTLVQQLFHPGLFNRQRSASLSDDTDTNAQWQRMPTQKRNHSPEDNDARKNQAKRTQNRQQLTNKLRGITTSPDQNINLISQQDVDSNNRFSLLDVDVTDKETPKAKRAPKPPAIILYGIDDLSKLTKLIEEVVDKKDFTYRAVSRDKIVISTNTVDAYKSMIERIREKGLIGYTFTRKDQKCMRIVIKHLHYSTPKEEIIAAIEKTGNAVQGEIVTARRSGTKEQLNTFFVNIVPHENNKNIKDIRVIYNQRVLIEDPKRKNTIVQCKRCQQYGHSKNNCMKPYRCVKCAGEHETTKCTIDRNSPAVCTLCSGSHPASYKGCQVYREILTRKNLVSRSRQPANSAQQHRNTISSHSTIPIMTTTCPDENSNGKATEEQILNFNLTNDNKKYSEILKKLSNKTRPTVHKDVVDLTRTQNLKTDERTRQTHTKFINKESTQYNSRPLRPDNTMKSAVGYKPQRTQPRILESGNNPQEHGPNNLEELIFSQAERIDMLINQLSTITNLLVTLISKLS